LRLSRPLATTFYKYFFGIRSISLLIESDLISHTYLAYKPPSHKMAPSGNRPAWQRIYRQTLTLMYKNLLIFYKTPIATLVRALIFPVVFTIIMCKLQNVADFSGSSPYYGDPSGTIASRSTPVQDLHVALKASHSQRLVFVRNGMYSKLCKTDNPRLVANSFRHPWHIIEPYH